jgi:hypothetical protein
LRTLLAITRIVIGHPRPAEDHYLFMAPPSYLAPGTINLRLGAVRRLAYEAADRGLLSADLAAGIRTVKGVKKFSIRLGNWLTAEGDSLLQAPDPSV